MVIWGKKMCPVIRGVRFLECPLVRDFTVFVSFNVSSHACAGHQWNFSITTSLVVVVPKSVTFLIWWIMSELEREKSQTICHVRGQTCSLTSKSLTQFYYIYKITSKCLPYYSERRSRKSWELVAPSSQQYSGLVPAIKKFLSIRKKVISML